MVPNLTEFTKRSLSDRRKQPTPALSWYTLFGRRQTIRRKSDQLKSCYVDRHSSSTFFLLALIIGLNVLDALFTMMILELKGVELNPVVRAVITSHGENFWIWKFFLVSTCSIILCLHSKFRLVKTALLGICVILVAVVVYQITLLVNH